MKRIIKGLLIITAAALIMGASAEASSVRYTTQAVALKDKAGGKTIRKVKANARLTVRVAGKKWARVTYKGQEYAVVKKYLNKQNSPKKYTATYFRKAGRINWHGCSFTWYSQRVLPGGGLNIPGRHVDKRGFVCDKDGYIVIASTVNMKKKHAVVATPFGKFGKVYDCGAGSSKWRDCYVAW